MGYPLGNCNTEKCQRNLLREAFSLVARYCDTRSSLLGLNPVDYGISVTVGMSLSLSVHQFPHL